MTVRGRVKSVDERYLQSRLASLIQIVLNSVADVCICDIDPASRLFHFSLNHPLDQRLPRDAVSVYDPREAAERRPANQKYEHPDPDASRFKSVGCRSNQ